MQRQSQNSWPGQVVALCLMIMPCGRKPTASASLGTEIRVPQVAARAIFTKCDFRIIRSI